MMSQSTLNNSLKFSKALVDVCGCLEKGMQPQSTSQRCRLLSANLRDNSSPFYPGNYNLRIGSGTTIGGRSAVVQRIIVR
jgi:hypothetical protein